MSALPSGGVALPMNVASRSGVLPWLKMMTADAPAASAFRALSAKLQPPRWMSAMLPTGKPAKSFTPAGSATIGAPTAASVKAPSHPLVLARGGVRLMSTGTTSPVTVPSPLPEKTPVS